MRQQLALGEFVFGLSSGFPYSTLERRTSGGWVDLDIIGSKPVSHNTGQGLGELRLTGKAALEEGMTRLDELRALEARRAPQVLVDGLGRNWGRWRIDGVTERQTRVLDDGTAMMIEWTLELREFVNA